MFEEAWCPDCRCASPLVLGYEDHGREIGRQPLRVTECCGSDQYDDLNLCEECREHMEPGDAYQDEPSLCQACGDVDP